jgi:50S ribosomal protein L16 3-hydroxylase
MEKNCLGEITVDEFLQQYWQKKPLLIRNAFPDIEPPLSADELAGLACEEHVNARLVIEQNDSDRSNQDKHDNDSRPWHLEFGPFDESRFGDLPESNWSLLVSDVERHLPETKFLLNAFRFVPDWRVDDLMISYAPPGGSVGAHTDAYDVFLIQLSGQRLWKISENFSTETIENIDLCILKEFSAENEWLLDAGDMLYLPPNVAHHGVAQQYRNTDGKEEACMTASVGFRAPSVKTMCNEYVHFLNERSGTETFSTEARYRDISTTRPVHHAEISEDSISHVIDYLKQGITFEREQVKQWLGQYCSDNKAFEDLSEDLSEMWQNLDFDGLCSIAKNSKLQHSPYSNFLFSYTEQAALLFVDGCSYPASKQFAEMLCEDDIDFKTLQQIMQDSDKEVLLKLFCSGAIIPS